MIFVEPLYFGDKASENKEELIRSVRSGRFMTDVYLLAEPLNPADALDIIRVFEFRQPYYQDHEPVIYGMARGRDDAFGLVVRITDEALAQTGSADIGAYLRQRRKRGDAHA